MGRHCGLPHMAHWAPYRVLFRRNNSLMRGCVKWTSPLLDMLVTRSLWSKMCKSILSVASSAVSSVLACGGGNTRAEIPFKRYSLGPDDGHCQPTLPPRPTVFGSRSEKHPTQSDSSLFQLLYIQITWTGPQMTRPLFLKAQIHVF